MELALAIVSMINAATPGVASLISIIRNKDGTVTVLQVLDQADAQLDKNIKTVNDWLAAHPPAK